MRSNAGRDALRRSLSSDNPDAGIPDVIGKTVQDFMFNLDWEIADPRITSGALTAHGKTLSAIRTGRTSCRR